jgi:hypothetical protein
MGTCRVVRIRGSIVMILYHWLRTGSFHSSPLISDENSENPLTPLHRLSTASLSGVVRCVAIATLIFRYFLRYFSSTSTEQIFPDSAGPFRNPRRHLRDRPDLQDRYRRRPRGDRRHDARLD